MCFVHRFCNGKSYSIFSVLLWWCSVSPLTCSRSASYSCKLLLFDGLVGSFRTIRLRDRRKDCAVCGDNPTVLGLIDYPQFCGSRPDDKGHPVCMLDPKERVTCQVCLCACVLLLSANLMYQPLPLHIPSPPPHTLQEYKQLVDSGRPHLLVDVREAVQYEICSLPNSISILSLSSAMHRG